MASEILAAGSGAANSSDVTIASGSTLTVSLKSYDIGARVAVQLKDDAGGYQEVGQLRGDNPGAVLSSGVYRFARLASSTSCGVFSG